MSETDWEWPGDASEILQGSKPMSETTEQQLWSLQQQCDQLYQEGRYEQALLIARDICDMTQRAAGEALNSAENERRARTHRE